MCQIDCIRTTLNSICLLAKHAGYVPAHGHRYGLRGFVSVDAPHRFVSFKRMTRWSIRKTDGVVLYRRFCKDGIIDVVHQHQVGIIDITPFKQIVYSKTTHKISLNGFKVNECEV